jgi:hypothetical protein
MLVGCGGKCSWFLLWDLNNLRHIITQCLQHNQVRLSLTGGLDRVVCIDSAHSAFKNNMSADKERNSARSLFHPLSDNCSAHAKDPRDKCVALAGFLHTKVYSHWRPKYTCRLLGTSTHLLRGQL